MRILEIGAQSTVSKNSPWRQWFVFCGLGLFVGAFLLVFVLELVAKDGLNPHKFHSNRWAQIGTEHWLGTDQNGRDVFALLVSGAYTSFLMSVVSTLAFFIFGTALGVLSGYFSGWLRNFVNTIFRVIHTFPILLLLLILTILTDLFFYGRPSNTKFLILMALFGVFSSPKLAEMIRGRILSLKERAFIESATALGLSHKKIIFRHILWLECRSLIFVQCAYMMGQAILMETTLTYLNFGVEYPLTSWGLMLRQMQDGFRDTTIAFNQVGVLLIDWWTGAKHGDVIARDFDTWMEFIRYQPFFPIFAIAIAVLLFGEFARYLSDRYRIETNDS